MKFENLPLPGKLNVLCNRECKRRLGQVNEEREQVEKHGTMSGAGACVAIQGKPITGRIPEAMARRKYWRKVAKHLQMAKSEFEDVDWVRHSRAVGIERSPALKRII